MYHAGTFITGKSFLYKLDPRVKLTFIIILSVFILWSVPIQVYFLGVGLLVAALASKISIRTLAQSVKPLLIFIIMIFLAHALFRGSNSSFAGISMSGAHEGFIVVLRFLCLLAAAVLLTMTTAPSALIAAVKYYLRPLKYLRVPVDDIAVMIMLALRLMPLLLLRKERIESAQKARCYDVKRAGLMARVRAFLSLILAVLLAVFRRADELALAMEARCYARQERTSAITMKITTLDHAAIIIFVIAAIIFMALKYYLS
ncbi:MAG TPA: energy-coupling factor transporter transmembrane protein EcfT [Deltaproteobacteria bacterium]|nr:energy-coupling factor transporter transmembrane protein EcfT [Deltaproteobacteria bacterium]